MGQLKDFLVVSKLRRKTLLPPLSALSPLLSWNNQHMLPACCGCLSHRAVVAEVSLLLTLQHLVCKKGANGGSNNVVYVVDVDHGNPRQPFAETRLFPPAPPKLTSNGRSLKVFVTSLHVICRRSHEDLCRSLVEQNLFLSYPLFYQGRVASSASNLSRSNLGRIRILAREISP